jgi:tRNA pseudouridine32 synthase/23S rRNA pseudouridine746 synthase
VHRTSRFICINKPAGLSFHRTPHDHGIAALLREQEGLPKLYPVHRLDKVTSGLLLFALDRHAAADLTAQFRNKTIQKWYCALSAKKPKKKMGCICGDMVKGRRGAYMLSRSRENPATTSYISCGTGTGLRLLVLCPLSGKTHQIRVACKAAGAPILGDPLYAPAEFRSDRTYLHACALRFRDNGETFSFFCAPSAGEHFISEQVREAVVRFKEPWHHTWPGVKK